MVIFELKGGTSLSKGFDIIERFSEDIDIHIHPNNEININPNNRNTKALEDRKAFYDQIANEIKIDGIISIIRDHEFDSPNLLSGGIRLNYESYAPSVAGIKEGILLEVGFDTVAPNIPRTISSWAFDNGFSKLGNIILIDNRAIDVFCYHPGYTFVEKLQTIATKYRQELEQREKGKNFMRQYYDVAELLKNAIVDEFIGTNEYKSHIAARFRPADMKVPLCENEAFLLSDPKILEDFSNRYKETKGLYYMGQPSFMGIIEIIRKNIGRF